MSTNAKIKCIHCKKQIIITLPEHKKGTRHINTLTVIKNNLPKGWTSNGTEFRCDKCS